MPLEQALLGLFRQKAERMPKDGLKIKSVKNSDTGQWSALVNIMIISMNYGNLPEFREGGAVRDGGFPPAGGRMTGAV